MDAINKNNHHDEVNLKELFLIVWAHKFLILFISISAVLFGVYLLLNTEKIYTSQVTFKMSSNQPENIQFGGDVRALAGLAGINMQSDDTISEETIKGRIFVEKIDKKLNLQDDIFFNTYKKNYEESHWLSKLKQPFNFKPISLDPNEVIWQGIVGIYSKNISLDISKNNIIKISATHKNALRAAEIANVIMDNILTEKKAKKNSIMNDQLDYLTNTMANSLSELELVQSKLKTFAMENSALPLENFAIGSLQLDSLREKLKRAEDIYNATLEIKKILQKKYPTTEDYINLKNNFPIVDKVEFRRVLGQNETISSWSWPERTTILVVLETLFDRKRRLQSEIDESQKAAIQSGKALEVYAKLKREEKIAEATYTVLIEQVKAQSMSAGYKPDNSTIYEYAAPSISPSGPNKFIYLIISLIFGLFVGVLISFLIAVRKKVFYSKEALTADVKTKFAINIKTFFVFRKKSLRQIIKIITNKSFPALRDITVEINKNSSGFVLVSSAQSKLKSFEFALTLASYMQRDKVKVAVINFSHKNSKLFHKEKHNQYGAFEQIDEEVNISILRPVNYTEPMDFLGNKDFSQNLIVLKKSFDIIFICSDNNDALSLVRAIRIEDIFHIVLTRLKHTKVESLVQMQNIIPTQGLFYD